MYMEPLAARLRPQSLDTFVGQSHLVGPGMPLTVALEEGHRFSCILWGPPGVGKTTLARIYATALNDEYHELSAVSASKQDIRTVLSQEETSNQPAILFLDEIHRFNKAQQDFLLPYVESGQLILIGATTENPSFEVIPALLSRCRVFVLERLSDDELDIIIDRCNHTLDTDARAWLIAYADGDARKLLSALESTQHLYDSITVDQLKTALQTKHLRYDKHGEEHYDTISAFIKSMRASQVDAALYYLARMISAGEDPVFIARRMVIFASEDIGLAQPTALVVANAVFEAVRSVGMPEAGINLAHGATYLAKAHKDRSAYDAFKRAMQDVSRYGNLPIPFMARNAPTPLMKDMGYSKDYELYTTQDLLPEKLSGSRYYRQSKDST